MKNLTGIECGRNRICVDGLNFDSSHGSSSSSDGSNDFQLLNFVTVERPLHCNVFSMINRDIEQIIRRENY